MARTPQQCFEDHLQALASGDLDRIAADYTDDAIHITSAAGTGKPALRRGIDGVKEGFAAVFGDLAAAGEVKSLEVPTRVFEEDTLYIEWWADLGDKRCDGVDSFIFRDDGQIRFQSVHYAIS
jgi:ketosteroid isomerase-like protein